MIMSTALSGSGRKLRGLDCGQRVSSSLRCGQQFFRALRSQPRRRAFHGSSVYHGSVAAWCSAARMRHRGDQNGGPIHPHEHEPDQSHPLDIVVTLCDISTLLRPESRCQRLFWTRTIMLESRICRSCSVFGRPRLGSICEVESDDAPSRR